MSLDLKTLTGDCSEWTTDSDGNRTWLKNKTSVSLDINDRLTFKDGAPDDSGSLFFSTALGDGDYASVCPNAGLSQRSSTTNPGFDIDATCEKQNCRAEGRGLEQCDVQVSDDISDKVENDNGGLDLPSHDKSG